MRSIPQAAENSKEIILRKALLRATHNLGVERSELAQILGISEPTLSRLYKNTRNLDLESKEGELVILFLQIYQYLTQLFGGNLMECQKWLQHQNAHLGGIPLELLKQISGLIAVKNYLEFMNGKI